MALHTSGVARRLGRQFSLALILTVVGCHSLGPTTVQRDRAEYSDAIARSWKRQTLLNLVKLRYLDPPIFVDVGQIVAGYSLETSLNVGASFPETNTLGGNTTQLGGAARYTDRPTVTYVPLTGNAFMRSLLAPLQPSSMFFYLQSGSPADVVFLASLASLNGLQNQRVSIEGVAPPDPRFLRAIELLRTIQAAGALGIRVEAEGKGQEVTTLSIGRGMTLQPEVVAARSELYELMGLDPEVNEFTVVFGPTAPNPRELSIVTRSLMQLMQLMAWQVDVPTEQIADGRVPRGWSETAGMPEETRLIRVHSGKSAPEDAAVAVGYRDSQYWIDDRDLRSKRAFQLILTMFTVASAGGQENKPVITIPAQ